MSDIDHAAEMQAGRRFAFGENWARFLSTLDEKRIEQAKASLQSTLGMETLSGKSFLDVGSGSGLFSLAARMLGSRVCSFDYDPKSVACTSELKSRYFADDPEWRIEEGSALDPDYLDKLGKFDVVYSWGVLHHTGEMWRALDLVARCVKVGGNLFIALYNDQGWISTYWLGVKRLYNAHLVGKWLTVAFHFPYLVVARAIARAMTGRLRHERGMALWNDMHDWLGGLPFEVTSQDAVVRFYERRGLILQRRKNVGNRHGCNEFVFAKTR
jgi:2-polyprenyl-3-methyl-5-hydroxy-6-metoxy-1,4-benzoquinol methylase